MLELSRTDINRLIRWGKHTKNSNTNLELSNWSIRDGRLLNRLINNREEEIDIDEFPAGRSNLYSELCPD
jgi:hypothetical protein